LEVTYVISLYPLSIATAVIVKNTGPKPVELTSAILSHIKMDNRRGTGIDGLYKCSYCAHPPLASSFGILSPSEAMKPDDSGWFGSSDAPKAGVWTVEEEKYLFLKEKLSRVYAAPPSERSKRVYRTPPSNYTTIDKVLLVLSFLFLFVTYGNQYKGLIKKRNTIETNYEDVKLNYDSTEKLDLCTEFNLKIEFMHIIYQRPIILQAFNCIFKRRNLLE
jgi:hypothetical protein